MLKHPIADSFSAFEMTNGQREIPLFDRLDVAFAPHAHDAAGRRANIFPLSAAHRVLIDFPEIGLGPTRQLSQRLRIDFHAHHPPDLHRGGIKRQGILDLDAFGYQVGFLLALNNERPLTRRRRSGDADQDDRKHQGEICHAAAIAEMSRPPGQDLNWVDLPLPAHPWLE